ncbi:hypothetical protein BDV11DRAFT_3087 [Aspergillus similis]
MLEKTYGASDPQAFERLGETGGYSLNRLKHGSRKPNIPITTGPRSMDAESSEFDQQRLRDHVQDLARINITHSFSLRLY